jgi:hypothetical protein
MPIYLVPFEKHQHNLENNISLSVENEALTETADGADDRKVYTREDLIYALFATLRMDAQHLAIIRFKLTNPAASLEDIGNAHHMTRQAIHKLVKQIRTRHPVLRTVLLFSK